MKRSLSFVAVNVLGAAAFAYPFFLQVSPAKNETFSHASDAPIVFTLMGILLIVVAMTELRAGRMDAKQIALLGLLSGVNAMLRVPGALAGASLMFVLPILCGAAFGPRFGFLLGAMSMAASAAITGGVGPWLPFEMFGLGWVGAGAGFLPKRTNIVVLAAYGWFAGLAYGALVDLWFWPFLQTGAAISWVPGAGALETAHRYWRFYLLTSLAWDSARAMANAALLLALGRPLMRLFMKFRSRLFVRWEPEWGPSQRATIDA